MKATVRRRDLSQMTSLSSCWSRKSNKVQSFFPIFNQYENSRLPINRPRFYLSHKNMRFYSRVTQLIHMATRSLVSPLAHLPHMVESLEPSAVLHVTPLHHYVNLWATANMLGRECSPAGRPDASWHCATINMCGGTCSALKGKDGKFEFTPGERWVVGAAGQTCADKKHTYIKQLTVSPYCLFK